MTSSFSTGRLVSLLLLASVLLPADAFAQVGITGSSLSGQAEEMRGKTPFNTGFKSKSALGQLEELTGSKVDRSSSNNQAPRTVPKARPSAPRFDANQAFRNELAGAVVGMLFESLFNDNAAKQKAAAEAAAAEAAARAAAEAEAFRVQQELARIARIHQAQRYRAEWDSRESEIGDRLGDAFTVGTGTAFFGQPAGPDAAGAAALSLIGGDSPAGSDNALVLPDSDPSVVDLRDSSLVVQPFASPARPSMGGRHASPWTYEMTDNAQPPPPPASTRQLNALIAYFGPWLGKWYWETVIQGYAKSTAWGRLEGLPGMGYVNAVVGANEQRISNTEELGGAVTDMSTSFFGYATNTAAIAANPFSNGDAFIESTSGSMDYQVRELKVKIWEMVFDSHAGQMEMPGADDLATPEAEGNVEPIYGRGDQPDQFRLNRVLMGRPAGT